MNRMRVAAWLAAGLSLFAAQAASAQMEVELSGTTHHVAVCPRIVAKNVMRCFAHVVTDENGKAQVNVMQPDTTPAGYSPAQLRNAYNVTAKGSSSTTIAIVDAFGYKNAEADLKVYRKQYGLPVCSTANGCFGKYNQTGVQGSYPVANTGWAQETALDLDMASAMCPQCHIILVEANNSSTSNLAKAVNTAASLGAHVISNSYGGAEAGSTSFESSYNHPGIAITASTGDSGYAAGVQFPASSPHVTAVGGTTLKTSTTAARGWTEKAWVDAGSGCSAVYPKPVWQTDPSCSGRMIADVSAEADPNTGVAVYGPTSSTASGWMVFGGTSVAAPLIGGIYGANGGTVNYGADPYAAAATLNDVTKGNNGTCGGTYFCTAGAGYDGPTGLGTPNGTTGF